MILISTYISWASSWARQETSYALRNAVVSSTTGLKKMKFSVMKYAGQLLAACVAEYLKISFRLKFLYNLLAIFLIYHRFYVLNVVWKCAYILKISFHYSIVHKLNFETVTLQHISYIIIVFCMFQYI